MNKTLSLNQDDLLVKMAGLYQQAKEENSHYYTASVLAEAIQEIARLRVIESKAATKKRK
jgi:hypothetical protein